MVQGFKPSVDRPTGGESPLIRFKGVLAEYKAEEKTRQSDQGKYVIISFHFSGIEVIDSEEPYPFPIVVLSLSYKPPKDSRGGTKWDAFAASLRKLLPTNPDLDLLVGKQQEWARLPAKVRSPLADEEGNPQLDGNQKQLWGDVDVLCWKVVSVEGIGSAAEKDEDFNKFLVELANGKTEPKFYEDALTNAEVTARPNIVEAIVGRKLLSTLTEMGLITRDAEGILHKVTADNALSGSNPTPSEAPA